MVFGYLWLIYPVHIHEAGKCNPLKKSKSHQGLFLAHAEISTPALEGVFDLSSLVIKYSKAIK